MRMAYANLDADNIGGNSQADYLVGLDADFTVSEGPVVMFREQAFPVVELARSLFLWLTAPDRGDFVFDLDGRKLSVVARSSWTKASSISCPWESTRLTLSIVEQLRHHRPSALVRKSSVRDPSAGSLKGDRSALHAKKSWPIFPGRNRNEPTFPI